MDDMHVKLDISILKERRNILKFGAMHFSYQINRLVTTKVDSTYLG